MKKCLLSLFILLTSLQQSSFAQVYDFVRSFGNDCGRATFIAPANVTYELIETIVLPDGKTLLLGNTYNSILNNFTISMIRVDICGIPDSSFGVNGFVDFTFNQRNSVYSFKVDSIGRIYCVGYEAPGNGLSSFRAFIARFNSNGSADTTFGDNGRTVESNSAIANSSSLYTGLVIQPDGKVVAWGTEGANASGGGNSCISRRYNNDGSLDSTFNLPANYPSMSSFNSNFALSRTSGFLQTDGSIYFNYIDVNNQMVLVKLTSTGSLDTTFHTTGFSVLPMTSIQSFPAIRQLANGYWRGVISQIPFAIVFQLQPNGDLDSTFGTNGLLNLPHIPGTNSSESGQDIFIDAQERTWIFGSASGPFGANFGTIWRLTPTFALDSTFEGTGYKYFYPDNAGIFRNAVPLQDERILIGVNSHYTATIIDTEEKVLSIAQGSTIEFCDSSTATISTTCSDLTVACYSYQWYRNGIAIGANSSELVITQAGDYYLVGTYNGGTDTSEIITASIIVNPIPTISQSNDTLFSTYSGAGMSWQWMLDGIDIVGATSAIYVTNVQGNYSVSVTDSNTCANTSLPFFAVGINNVIDQNSFVIFPNPANNEINLKFSDASISEVQIQLIDISGKIILVKRIDVKNSGSSVLIPTQGISSGYYFARLSTLTQTATYKIIINH